MKTDLRTTRTLWYLSEVNLDVETDNEEYAKAIRWADETPIAYEIIRSRKSRIFGSLGSAYQGWQRGDSHASYLARLVSFHALTTQPQVQSELFASRVTFALEHFEDEGYRSGIFQQHAVWSDGATYPRSSLELDYTKPTLESQLDAFCKWMDAHMGRTTKITIDGLDARVFTEDVRPPKRKKEIARRKSL